MSRQMCPAKAEPTPCDCPIRSCVISEMRDMGQPGGPRRALEAYYDELRARIGELQASGDPRDLPYRLQTIGVPSEDIIALGKPLEPTLALDAAKRFIDAPRLAGIRFLLLLGAPGVGKTLAAAYVIRHEARRFDWNGQATGSTEPIKLVQAGSLTRIDSHDRVDTANLDAMVRCRLLVVDDMGDEGGPIGRGALLDVLTRRDAAARATVITTNLTAERFSELYGAPLMSRIQARGIAPNLSKERSRRRRMEQERRVAP